MRTLVKLAATSGFLLALSPASAFAGTIVFSNLGAGDTWKNVVYSVQLIAPFASQSQQFVATAFIPSSSTVFDSVEVPISWIPPNAPNSSQVSSPSANVLDIGLWTDIGGLPGQSIETVRVFGAFTNLLPFESNLLFVSSTAHPVLSSGQQYWLVLSAPVPDLWGFWNMNNVGDRGDSSTANQVASRNGGASSPWILYGVGQERPAFRITGSPEIQTPVPEPSTFLLVGLGIGAIVARRWRRNKSETPQN